MKLTSRLTVGWQPGDPSARVLNEAAGEGDDYQSNLLKALGSSDEIHGVEELFHRQAKKGSRPIKRFTAALASAEADREIVLHIDVFAFVFLARASNFDFLMPEDRQGVCPFRDEYEARWRDNLHALEAFERLGHQPADARLRDQYLAVRKIVSRPSARDELRALAALLWSGPLTVSELKEELALNWPLADRVLAPFKNAGVLERRGETISIATEALPVVLFSLRELLGIDPLGMLNDGTC